MLQPEEILSVIEDVLDQLIVTADKLKELSRQVISEDDLEPLQQKQDALMKKLVEADHMFHEACRGKAAEYKSTKRARIGEKLEHFQKLNSIFIENLQASQGVLQFEVHRINKLKGLSSK